MASDQQRVLITGAFGNIGSGALAEMLSSQYQVRCLDLQTPANQRLAARYAGRYETQWGDIRDESLLQQAVAGQDVVVHLAAVIPPESNENPELARQVNLESTIKLVKAMQASSKHPKILLASTFDLFGYTQDQPPPRRVSDPVCATDLYTEHKLTCETLVQESGLDWLIFRFADVPKIALRQPHPIMFDIPLDTRIEVLHHRDAGLAITNALSCPEIWGTIQLIGGGASCQVNYRTYMSKMLGAMGIGMLPESAFSKQPYCTDWLDTSESQHLLQYQRYTFDDILKEISALLGFRRLFLPFASAFVRRSMLKLSPYYRR